MSTAASSSLSGLFSKGSASYAKFRPEYPAALYDVILQQASLPARDLAVDIATGSGQAAKDLSKRFARVIALDHNADQLQHAGKFPNVRFQEGAAENSGLKDGVADLAAVAQALHW
jgi:ubiquinone/menaquinone biosynthesis C-methylase UbiE